MFLKRQICFQLLVLLIFCVGCVPNNFKFKKELGQSGSGEAEFLSPTDLDLDEKGNLIVADAGNTRFQIISTDGKVIGKGGEYGVNKLKLQSISGIGVDKKDNVVWVCDEKGGKVVKFDMDGTPLMKITKHMKAPMDVVADSDNNIYVIMARHPHIYKYSDEGKFLKKLCKAGEKSALVFPTSIHIFEDIIYVTDFGGKRIVKLDLDGNFISEITNKGEYEEMKGPSGLYIDDVGNLYVLDLGEVPVVILSRDGKLISRVGTFGNHEGNFLYPTGVVALSKKDVYVLDNSRNTILNFTKK